MYYMTRVLRLAEEMITASAGPVIKTANDRQWIVRSVLLNSGHWRDWGNAKTTLVDVTLARVIGRQKDAVIILRNGKGHNLIALYEKHGKHYLYKDTVDLFEDLRDAQLMPLREQSGAIIVTRDRAVDDWKESVYIRAYSWIDGHFEKTLELTEQYREYHNELWDQNKPPQKSNWLKLAQRADIVWQNADAPVLHVLLHQNYSLSAIANQEKKPAEEEFELIRNRDVLEEYIWSGKWMHFILFEGTDLRSGEPVAVIEDLAVGPYGLLTQYINANRKYRVKYLDGTIEILDKENVRPGIEIKSTREM
jgi:hypothetical protein